MPARRLLRASFVLPALALAALVAAATATAKPPPVKPAAAVRGPEQAAQRLYAAWQRGNRRAATTVATSEVVTKLFGTRPQKLRAEGCERRDEGGWQCVLADRDLDFSVAFDVDGGASAGAYSVTAVSFSTEGGSEE